VATHKVHFELRVKTDWRERDRELTLYQKIAGYFDSIFSFIMVKSSVFFYNLQPFTKIGRFLPNHTRKNVEFATSFTLPESLWSWRCQRFFLQTIMFNQDADVNFFLSSNDKMLFTFQTRTRNTKQTFFS
jgi:hypothetical protein